MKKLKTLLSIVLFLAIILLGGNVYADMDAPSVSPYKAYISNPNGVKGEFYDEYKVLPYGTEITVFYEFEEDGINYVSGYYGEEWFRHIRIDDIKLVEEEFDMLAENSEVTRCDELVECIVLNPEGVQMYTGPAYAYNKKNVTIPFGTELTYRYEAANTWAYVTYNGQSGWICMLEKSIGYYREEKSIVSNPCNICDFYGNVIGHIPGNTLISEYYITDDWSKNAYITYNGITGFVENHWLNVGVANSDVPSLYSEDENKRIYEYADEDSQILGYIPKGNQFQRYYYNRYHTYVTYNGISGWITTYEEEFVIEEDPDTIANNVITNTYNTTTQTNNIITNTPTNIIENTNTITNTQSTSSITINPADQILILAILIAVVIAITSLVTILCMNKTKEDKK